MKKVTDPNNLSYFLGKIKAYFVHDVQVDGTSITSSGVASVPDATDVAKGVVKVSSANGLGVSNGTLSLSATSTPTADSVAKFDASAHINSTDMSSAELASYLNNFTLNTPTITSSELEELAAELGISSGGMSRLYNILNAIVTKLLPTESRSLLLTKVNVDATTTKWFQKQTGYYLYGAFIIVGTFAGVGGQYFYGIINNGSLTMYKDGAVWSGSSITFSYKIENNIGYVGIKTSASGGTIGAILWG